MSTSQPPSQHPQSWEHLFDRDPHSSFGVRVGVIVAILIHAAVFAVTWPIIAQAPPPEPELTVLPYPLTHFNPQERQPDPVVFEVPEIPEQSGPPIISVPPEHEPISTQEIEPMPPPGPVVIVPPAVLEPPPASDNDAIPTEPVLVGARVAPPKILVRVEPRYTEAARQARVQGIVILELVIDTGGVVESVKVLRGLPLGLTESAVTAVEQWRFAASTLNGHPIRIRYVLTVRFKLE
jgi:TonB family protein